MTREEHLAWCKNRALEYVVAGNLSGAFASMLSDMRKHPETVEHIGLELGAQLQFNGHLNSTRLMTEWIEGFN